MLMMTNEEYDRMNILSEKTLTLKASREELDEFYVLLERMKSSDKYNLVLGLPH
jgi:hypothetical protein